MSDPFAFEALTPRQREVIIRKAEGKTYGQVAHELGVTEQTVKNHLGLVYARLGAEHLIEALRILGWLRVPGESQPPKGHPA
jgi:DNA-binding NarL/FixJ family response regulator